MRFNGKVSSIRKVLGAGITALFIGLGVSAAYADTIPVSAGCQAGPGSATCFRPSIHIGSDPTGNLIPLFVEVTGPGTHAGDGAEAVISMQANLVGSEYIKNVFMNLDPLVDAAHVTISFHASTGGAGMPTITDGTNNQGTDGFHGFDIDWDFPTSNSPPSPRFNSNDLITFLVDCTGASCVNFNTSSFNFTEQSSTGNSGQGDWRICVKVNGVGTNGEGSDKVCGAASEVQVPEPVTLSLLGLGLLGVAVAGRIRRK